MAVRGVSSSGAAPAPETDPVLQALPVGVAIVDADRRIVFMNPAFHDALDLPPGSVAPGMQVEDALRAAAHRDVCGPGDPEAQVAAVLAADGTEPGRLRRRTFNGRTFDLHSAPLPGGGYVVCAQDITPVVAARDEAEVVLSRTSTALTTLQVGLAAFSPAGNLMLANARFGELLGLPPDHLTRDTHVSALLDAVAARDEFAGPDGAAFIAEQRRTERARPATARWVRGNGRAIDVASNPLPDGGWTMTVTDVTPVVQAEDEASRRARGLDAILDAIPQGICVFGPDQRVTMFNRAHAQVMAGVPLAIGDHWLDVVRRRAEAGEYGQGNVEEIVAQQTALDANRPQVRRRRRPNGMVVDVRTVPLPTGGFILVVSDITPLTAAEAELSHRAEEMAAMLASIHHGVMLWGGDHRLIASNAAVAHMMNHPQGLLTPGRTEDEILANMVQRGELGDGPAAQAYADGLRQLDRSTTYNRTLRLRDGRVIDIRSEPIPGGGWVSTYTDVTETRQTEEELRHAKEAAETANQAKSRFLATMSHELRTPLNSVIGFSDALLREAPNPTPARVAEFARQINEAGRSLLNLINIILDVARIEAGRFDLASDIVDVGRLVRAAVRQADAAAQAAEIALRVELPDHLPRLHGDERRLAQVLRQLLSNAVKFTEIGGTVTAGARLEPDGSLLIFVRDTGIGIPEGDLERVFEPFTQLDSTLARRYQGSGLGLYVSRALVSGHGGGLSLASRAGEGTTAEIRLPAAQLAAAPVSGGETRPATQSEKRPQKTGKLP
ncbi:MAG TPA: PAS-domain containing protein [Acetobacteraceae bacterium]|nr:PAS-domain containing protein [Acetobacteraceae bacterium]